jgi:hypothetical protein
MTADVVRAIDHNPPLLGAALGNVQTLPDGDLVVQWGTTQHFSQYTPSGALVLDATLPSNDDTYRVYRYPWSGRPTTPPAVAVLAQKHGGVHVDVSWNGATGVAEWRVLAGASRRTLTAVRTEPDTGFQTDIGLPSGYDDFQVEALDSASSSSSKA